MGRRAKNKQGAPEPLEPRVFTSPKRLGKRKAEDGEKTAARPVKKVKDLNGNVKSKASQGNKGKGKLATDGNLSDGWEAVEDDADMKAKAKSVNLKMLLDIS